MKTALALVFLLLAGCAAPSEDPVLDESALADGPAGGNETLPDVSISDDGDMAQASGTWDFEVNQTAKRVAVFVTIHGPSAYVKGDFLATLRHDGIGVKDSGQGNNIGVGNGDSTILRYEADAGDGMLADHAGDWELSVQGGTNVGTYSISIAVEY